MGIWKIAKRAAGLAAVTEGAVVAYFYNRTMKRGCAKTERTMDMSGTDWSKYMPLMRERKSFMLNQPHEQASVMSFDSLKLCATYFPPQTDSGRKRIVIFMHGYTGEGLTNFEGFSTYYFTNGFGALVPDARAHGASEGKYVGFGCPDRKDILKWIGWVLEREGTDVEILLHGVSMGGATALMTGSMEELPPQVKGVISDCAFTSAKEVFTHVLESMYHIPAVMVIPAADLLNKKLAGYGMDECNARREVAKAKTPILFIHGSKDNFVPCSMCDEMYENCASKKRKLIIEGASHAESYYYNMEAYEKAMTEFIDSVME